MCGPCWSLVPGELQREVYRTFRRWRDHHADIEAFEAWADAREAAIASIP